MKNKWLKKAHYAWKILYLSTKKFSSIDGSERAAAFTYFFIFSLFPLIVLLVTGASAFISEDKVGYQIINYAKQFFPVSGVTQTYIFDTLSGVVKARGRAGSFAFILLIWVSMQFFSTLIRSINRAWTLDKINRWRLFFKSIAFIPILTAIVSFGIAMPVLLSMARHRFLPIKALRHSVYIGGSFVIPLTVVFVSISILYRLAPNRITRFNEVWRSALITTIALRVSESGFVFYLNHFSSLNVVYGTFGGIMAVLLWIYISGLILIYGACLCATHAENRIKIKQ